MSHDNYSSTQMGIIFLPVVKIIESWPGGEGGGGGGGGLASPLPHNSLFCDQLYTPS